jgi:hypothetical protein
VNACQVYTRKPVLLSKHVLPLALVLVSEPKGDVRSATARLLRRLHQLMGDGLLSQCDAISKVGFHGL